MLCIGLCFGAYRWGFDRGFADGANQRSHVGTAYAKIYQVEDLLMPKLGKRKVAAPDAEPLVDDIRANVLPKTWKENGGTAHIATLLTNPSLIVSHDQDGHDRVAEYLDARRRKR